MGDIVNLSQFRKRRERKRKETRSLGKHIKSGLKKADQTSLRLKIEKRRRELDGKFERVGGHRDHPANPQRASDDAYS